MIHVFTDNPVALLQQIKKAIDEDLIPAWKYDNDNFICSTDTRVTGEYLQSSIDTKGTRLTLSFHDKQMPGLKSKADERYHYRFIELLKMHFIKDYTSISYYVS